MAFPIKICSICSEEFELKPDKPGFANRCPECSAPELEGKQEKIKRTRCNAGPTVKQTKRAGKPCAIFCIAKIAEKRSNRPSRETNHRQRTQCAFSKILLGRTKRRVARTVVTRNRESESSITKRNY